MVYENKIYCIIFFLGLLIATVSCDPYGGYEYWIDNKSDSTLFVIFKERYSPAVSRVAIDKQSSRQLKSYSSINGLYDLGNNFLSNYFDSLNIYIDTLKHIRIKKDYQSRTNWTYQKHSTGSLGRSGDNIYRLSISNADLK